MNKCPTCGELFDSERGLKVHHSRSHGERIDENEYTEKCPTCGDLFKTHRGLAVHHSTVHNSSIAGVEVNCEHCLETVKRKPYQIQENKNVFCSRECKAEYEKVDRINKTCKSCGEKFKTPVYEDCEYCSRSCFGGTENKMCELCGSEYRSRKSKSDSRFCSKDCLATWQSRNMSGQNSPLSTLKEVDCKVCGENILRPKWQREMNESFLCSEECRGRMMSELHYKGGYSRDEGKGWRRLKLNTRDRFNHTCQACGECCGERHHDVHHIKPIREFQNATDANFESNVTLLCRSCHKKVETLIDIEKQFKLLQNDKDKESWKKVNEILNET